MERKEIVDWCCWISAYEKASLVSIICHRMIDESARDAKAPASCCRRTVADSLFGSRIYFSFIFILTPL